MLRLTSLATTALLRLPTSGTDGTILSRAGVTLAGMPTLDRASVRGLAAGWVTSADPRFADMSFAGTYAITRTGPCYDSLAGEWVNGAIMDGASAITSDESGIGTSARPRTPNHSTARFAPYQFNQSHALASRPPDRGGTP